MGTRLKRYVEIALDACVAYFAPRLLTLLFVICLAAVVVAPPWILALMLGFLAFLWAVANKKKSKIAIRAICFNALFDVVSGSFLLRNSLVSAL